MAFLLARGDKYPTSLTNLQYIQAYGASRDINVRMVTWCIEFDGWGYIWIV